MLEPHPLCLDVVDHVLQAEYVVLAHAGESAWHAIRPNKVTHRAAACIHARQVTGSHSAQRVHGGHIFGFESLDV